MIYNILVLLIANVLIPLLPVPPELFITYCGYQYLNHQVTIYDDMNLNRHFTQEQFKKVFRDSLKRLHPDRGGDQETFAKVKGVKDIMQKTPNLYDLYNATDLDFKIHQSQEEASGMKELLYQFETVMFYFIALLYFIAFTIQEKQRGSRKILIPLTIFFCLYEFIIHMFPKSVTLIDIIDSKIPLFIQSILIKRAFCIITAIIRAKSIRRKDQESVLLTEIERLPIIDKYQNNECQRSTDESLEDLKNDYIKKLKRLQQIYVVKLFKMQQNEKSLITKIKGWISKGFSFLVIGLMIWGFIGSNTGSSNKITPSSQF